MKHNTSKITGVLHQQQSQQHYCLRRYFPDPSLTDWVEQFWLVDWDLDDGITHTQQNLPDPNFHLVISNDGVRIIGPVSKVYAYEMKGKGRIIGVKFELGALVEVLDRPLATYVDTDILARHVVGVQVADALASLRTCNSDDAICCALQEHLTPFVPKLSEQQRRVRDMVRLIKSETAICKVDQLAEYTQLSPRMLQRLFKTYVGLSPKLLIRKYRLHKALEQLDNANIDVFDIVAQLGYTDQSHLIRDFKDVVGVTPQMMMNKNSKEK